MDRTISRLGIVLVGVLALLTSGCADLGSTETAVAAPRDVPAGFIDNNVNSFHLATPGGWLVLDDEETVGDMLMTADLVNDLPAGAVSQFRSLLGSGHAVVAVGAEGDNVNAFRLRNAAGQIDDYELATVELEKALGQIATQVRIEAAPRFFGERHGVYTHGSYVLGGRHQAFVYQFATADGDDAYFATVTLMTGPDRNLADSLLGTLAVTG